MMYIPYGTQWIDEEDIEAVMNTLRSEFLTTGPKVEAFERAVGEYTGTKYAVAVSSGTAALHIACLAAGIGEGDEVITTPITFAASANCVLYTGATPVFADIDPVTYNIDPASIRKKITARTKAIIPVHYTGQPCDMEAIHKIAKEHHLLVIEDAAHALGATYKGIQVGGISDMTCFSFHPVKHITTGEGGMVMTNNDRLYHKLIQFRAHGITKDLDRLQNKNEGPWYYEQQFLGYNYRITDIQCALGLSQIKKLNQFVKRRREIASRYNEAFQGMKDIIIPKQMSNSKSSYHLYVIQVPEEKRRSCFEHLRENGIGVNVHYIPVYYHPYYQDHGYADIHCPIAEALYKRMLSIPMYPKLADEEQDVVIKNLYEALK